MAYTVCANVRGLHKLLDVYAELKHSQEKLKEALAELKCMPATDPNM